MGRNDPPYRKDDPQPEPTEWRLVAVPGGGWLRWTIEVGITISCFLLFAVLAVFFMCKLPLAMYEGPLRFLFVIIWEVVIWALLYVRPRRVPVNK